MRKRTRVNTILFLLLLCAAWTAGADPAWGLTNVSTQKELYDALQNPNENLIFVTGDITINDPNYMKCIIQHNSSGNKQLRNTAEGATITINTTSTLDQWESIFSVFNGVTLEVNRITFAGSGTLKRNRTQETANTRNPMLFSIGDGAKLSLTDVTIKDFKLVDEIGRTTPAVMSAPGILVGPGLATAGTLYSTGSLAMENVTVENIDVTTVALDTNVTIRNYGIVFNIPKSGLIQGVTVKNVVLSAPDEWNHSGGAFYLGPAADVTISGTNTLENVKLITNEYSCGGGIYAEKGAKVTCAADSSLTIASCDVELQGGGLWFVGDTWTVSDTFALFLKNNRATKQPLTSGLYHGDPGTSFAWNGMTVENNNLFVEYQAEPYPPESDQNSYTFRNGRFTGTPDAPTGIEMTTRNALKLAMENTQLTNTYTNSNSHVAFRTGSIDFRPTAAATLFRNPNPRIFPEIRLDIVSSDVALGGQALLNDGRTSALSYPNTVALTGNAALSSWGTCTLNDLSVSVGGSAHLLSGGSMYLNRCTVVLNGTGTTGSDPYLASAGWMYLDGCTVHVPDSGYNNALFRGKGGGVPRHSTLILNNAKILAADLDANAGFEPQDSVVLANLDSAQWEKIASKGYNMFNSLDIGVTGGREDTTDIAKGAASLGTLFLTVGGNDGAPQMESTAFKSDKTRVTMLQLGSRLKDAAGTRSGSAWYLTQDQRGMSRPAFASRDIGSVEVQPSDLPTVTGLKIVGFDSVAGLVAGSNGQLVEVSFDYTPRGYNYNFNSLIEWTSSSTDIVEIEGGTEEGESGKVTLMGKNPGRATVTVKLKDIGATDNLEIEVIPSLANLTKFVFNNQESLISGQWGQTELTIGLAAGARMMEVLCDAPDSNRYTYAWNVADDGILKIDTEESGQPSDRKEFVFLKPVSAGTTEVGVTVTFQNFSLTASCDVKVAPHTIPVGIKFEQPRYQIPLSRTTNTLLKIVHIEQVVSSLSEAARNAAATLSKMAEIVLPDELSFEGFYVKGENVYIYVKPKNKGAVHLDVTLYNDKNWPPASCDVVVYDTNATVAASEMSASRLFGDLNGRSLSEDIGGGTRVLQGPGLFESSLFRRKGTLKALSSGETDFFSILDNLPEGYDPAAGGVPLSWFAVKNASFAPVDASSPSAPLGLRVPGGRQGSEVDIEAPLGYPAEQSYLPMQAIFAVPRGVYGAGAFDRTLADPSLLPTEYCRILLQLPQSTGKRTVDLFGGEVENLTAEEALRLGTLEFFQDTATGELLAVLNFLLVDGTAPEGFEGPATYEDGVLRIYDGLMDGRFRERLWLADRNGEKTSESVNPNPTPKPDGEENSSSSGGGCDAAGLSLATAALLPGLRRRKR